MRCPEPLVIQVLLLYRYLHVLGADARTMMRARDNRAFGRRGKGIAVTGNLLGSLLLRSIERGERLYTAMAARGFDGAFFLDTTERWGVRETTVLCACVCLLTGIRMVFTSL